MILEQYHRVIGTYDLSYPEEKIKDQRMYFGCTPAYVMTREDAWSPAYKIAELASSIYLGANIIIDSRVHMLMPGWYACIGGWHLDNAPRSGPFNQPLQGEQSLEALGSEHLMLIIGESAMPVFLERGSQVDISPAKGHRQVYKRLHEKIEWQIEFQGLKTAQINSGEIVHFNGCSFHKGTPATVNCWRYFIRASVYTDRKPVNEIRRQVQAYVPINEGW